MDCLTSHIELQKHLDAMLRVSGVLVGLPIKEVTGHTLNAMNCNTNHLSFEQLLKLCIGTDSCGKPALRVKIINSCTSLKTCTTKDDGEPRRRMFAYDSTAKTYALVINRST